MNSNHDVWPDYAECFAELQLRLLRMCTRSLPSIPVEQDGKMFYFTLFNGNLLQRIVPGMSAIEAGELSQKRLESKSGETLAFTKEQHRARYEALKPTEAQLARIFEAINTVPVEHRQDVSGSIAWELASIVLDPVRLFDFEIETAFFYAIDLASLNWDAKPAARSRPPYLWTEASWVEIKPAPPILKLIDDGRSDEEPDEPGEEPAKPDEELWDGPPSTGWFSPRA